MKTTNSFSYGLFVAVVTLTGCSESLGSEFTPRVNDTMPESSAAVPSTRSQIPELAKSPPKVSFHGGYAGGYEDDQCEMWWGGLDFQGTGKVSFLGRSTESGSVSCTYGTGTVTLTSLKHPKNQIVMYLVGDAMNQGGYSRGSPCNKVPLRYVVAGGSGKFGKVTGSGAVLFHCLFSGLSHSGYYDNWSGTLSF